ncbi:arginase [Asanoa ishikariensis]|uniref:Arginase n=1 Tax=Asanoa ishikariensis TaxID=137265 RepID=A0A1H3RET8_9ACTN|nr:arginase [Asanoa ishikariensis]
MRRIALLDAPSNLGLRPPTPTSTPGCAKAPGALRDHGLLGRLVARDAGCLTPPRYDPGDWRPGDGVCHADAIAAYSVALAGRIGAIIDADEFPVVLGGDCSILLGSALAMHRLGEAVGGRIGLVFVDGHSDFRHPGNASYVGAAAGEDLALATGRGQAELAAIEGRRPYFRDIDVVVLGIRAQDEYRLDLQAAGILTRPVPALRAEGAARSAQWARDQLADCAGYWVHVDVDVLDPAVMPAVDAPDPGGIAFTELELLIAGLVDTPHCLGIELTVFDPDYDPDGAYAAEIVSSLVAGLAPIRAAASASTRSPLAFTQRRRPAPDADRFRPPLTAVEPDPEPAAVAVLAPVVEPPAPSEPEPEPVEEPEEVVAPAAEEESPSPERKKPTIGRQRRSAFDVIPGDAGKRRSAADILAAPLGGDSTGPGRLRRTTDGEAVRSGGLRRATDGDAATDVRPGGLRRATDGEAVRSGGLGRATDGDAAADVRPGGLGRATDGEAATDVRPGGLRRAADGEAAADVRPGGLRRRPAADGDAVPTDVRPGGLRRKDSPADADADAVTTDARPGGLRRKTSPDDGDAVALDVRPGGLRPDTDEPPAADEG